MNLNILSALILIFVFARNISSGSALLCYQCEEIQGRQCDLNVRNVLTENCTTGFVCTKFIWKVNKTSTVSRRCAPHTICEEQKALATSNLTLTHCSTCNNTLCNSSSSISLFLPTIFVICIALVKILEIF